MFCIKITPYSLLILTALILAFLSSPSSTGAGNVGEDSNVSPDVPRLLEGNGVGGRSTALVLRNVSRDVQRLLEGNGEGGKSTPLTLAKERTRRKDPADGFKYYTGGWDIKNKHYLYSVLFSGAPLFVIAACWFVGFGIFLMLICLYVCCCSRKRYGYSKFAYVLSLLLLILFTLTAVVGSAILYTGQAKFSGNIKNTLDYVLDQGNLILTTLKDVSNYLNVAKKIGIVQQVLPQDIQNQIDKVNNMIGTASNAFESATKNNRKDIYHILDRVKVALIVIAAIMLAMALLGFLLSILGLQFLVYILIIVCWVLVALTFILSGVCLVLHNAVGDTCVAMNEWVNSPTTHTTLDDIIPCIDPATSQAVESISKEVTLQVIRLVNGIITDVANGDVPPAAGPLYFNQSGPLIPRLCNPYNSDKTARTCRDGEIGLNESTQVWKNYQCQVSGGICTTVGRLTPSLYKEVSSVANVSYGLYHHGPFLTSLVNCSLVRDTFAEIHNAYCPGLKRFIQWVYIGLVVVSGAVMISMILWVLYARERKHRKYTKLVDANSGLGMYSFDNGGPHYS